tara:strand:+ start:850 stop:1134 length:285 start_codon:yes stop_codon:yes gene_type:complete
MDKPTLDTLHELTGDGTQTIIDSTSGAVTGDFYRLDCITTCVFDALSIDGVAQTAIIAKTIIQTHSFHNVTSLTVGSGACIGYTAPSLTGQIEP